MLAAVQLSCQKYLDKKLNETMAVPSSLNDLQLLQNSGVANDHVTAYGELVADNFYLTTSAWNSLEQDQRQNYIWAPDARIRAAIPTPWYNPYKAVYEANLVLELLPGIAFDESERPLYNSIKGVALFTRAYMFHHLAQLFCQPYSSSAATDPGIVLRMTSEVEVRSVRATVQQTYDQIISDANAAVALLPEASLYNSRPDKAAAYGLLARVYLSMRDYARAAVNAEAALHLQSTLIDYNTLAPANNPVLPSRFIDNPEILFMSSNGLEALSGSGSFVDPVLYQSYADNDLRKAVFFGQQSGGAYWKGSYNASTPRSIFNGIATDEVLLIRAECRARAGNTNEAMNDLNYLLRRRWKTGTFTDLTAPDAAAALQIILVERRKELVYRCLRWSDLRRFNLEGANITLSRTVNNTTYTLPPGDLRWVLPIPDVEVIRSGIPQNPR